MVASGKQTFSVVAVPAAGLISPTSPLPPPPLPIGLKFPLFNSPALVFFRRASPLMLACRSQSVKDASVPRKSVNMLKE